MDEQEIRADERAKCRKIIEEYSAAHVNKWVNLAGDGAKAEGWAILVASAELKPVT